VPKKLFTKSTAGAVPLFALKPKDMAAWRRGLDKDGRAWAKACGFSGAAGTACLMPGLKGKLSMAAVGVGAGSIWDWATVAKAVPAGRYRLGLGADGAEPDQEQANTAALGWALAGYAFTHYKESSVSASAQLVWPKKVDPAYVLASASATYMVRDLINTPANHMGPTNLAGAASALAKSHKARIKVIVGDKLLKVNYPAIHAVGRASDDAPRLIDMVWGKASNPKVTLVGKGVCFDSGGLDIKSAAGMKIMKKDMGGAAHVLGLASMIMALKLPVRLRVLIPAVENSISGNAMRPGDVVATRKGLSIEIGNTDAEGRVVLADALAEATSENPRMIFDFATLTGAARVALGTELPALFCNDNKMAEGLLSHSNKIADPLWRMPLWAPYNHQVSGKVADVNNAPDGGYGGAITAALFLERFVDRGKGAPQKWAHIDLMAWNLSSRPGRPEGGEAMGIRALYSYLADCFGRNVP
jgi:leucyl aminopeptidase